MLFRMPIVIETKQFEKDFKKLPLSVRDQFYDRLRLLITTPGHPILRKHKLHGIYQGCMSINITGDYRAIFQYTTTEKLLFQRIGTHSQLYK